MLSLPHRCPQRSRIGGGKRQAAPPSETPKGGGVTATPKNRERSGDLGGVTVPNDSAGQATANRVFSRAQPQQLSRVLAGPRLSRSTFARSSRLELFHAWLGKEEERRKAVATRLKGSYSASESPSFLSLCAEGCRQRDDVGGAAESIAICSLLSLFLSLHT